MIWGIEGRHSWDGDAVILNRRVDDDGFRVLPRYKVRNVLGLQSLGDSEDVRELAVGREGEIPRRSFRRGKTVTYEGVVQAATLADLREAEADLRAAFDDQRTEKVMEVTPHPDYDPAEPSRFFRARALALEDPDVQGPPRGIVGGFERDFVLSVRASDRRYYDGAEQTESVLVVDADDSESMVCANGGTVATDPVLTVTCTRVVAASWASVMAAGLPMQYSGGPPLTVTRAGDVISAGPGLLGHPYMDGVQPLIGYRILYFDPAGGADDDYGIYVIDYIASDYFQATRAADADAGAEFAQFKTVAVGLGAQFSGRTLQQLSADPTTVNTTPLSFGLYTGAAGLVIANDTVGVSLIFPTLNLVDGDELVIDFRTRRVLLNGTDTPGILSPQSDWWDTGVAGLAPGNNTIRVESFVGDPGDFDVTCEVAWHDAYV